MIRTLLIANRGEIACRIIRTARRMGIATVAVHSEADANALHVRRADAAVAIGPAPARESYLVPEKILAAAKASGADAIHPGYGFLSENAEFAEAVIAAGLTWVGPPPSAIRAMGLKDAAKALMAKAGVPVTPGYLGEDQSEARLAKEADKIGYPLLIKAVAGGGGKGMRKVDAKEDFLDALTSCRREAAASFGDDRVLLEIYVTRPRHIEVQVFADTHGNAVHLFERDCSVQRRHQKVIEEAPAPGMGAEARAAVCEAAVQAARAVAYEGAGTIEFIADGSEGLRADRIWFMEMNTRLQVEHPVTEMITGQDLVEWQLRVAAGEPLPLRQDQLAIRGHAMEARLYAESPDNGFLPSTGPLAHFSLPQSIRVDTGVVEGDEVTAFYDPMIAKLIAYAPTREAAARTLAAACREVEVYPVKTNAAFLARTLDAADFVAGAVDTGFIAAHQDELVPAGDVPESVLQAAARAEVEALADPTEPWSALPGFRIAAAPEVRVELEHKGEIRHVVVPPGPAVPARAVLVGEELVVFEAGEAYAFIEPDRALSATEGGGSGAVTSPMPGSVVSVAVKVGDQVAAGQVLAAVEAMKMEHALKAPFDGVVAELAVSVGDQVTDGALIARLEKLSAESAS
jgi:acetyl/propionyl-CoA carboxylase alpha subunit